MSKTPHTITELYAYAADGGVDIFDGHGTSTAASILKRSDHVATALRDIGVRPGDRVAAWLENSNAYLSLHAACARLGAILVAINTRFGAAEIADITGRSGAKALAVNGDLSKLTDIDTNDLSNLTHLITVGICTHTPAWPKVTMRTFEDISSAPPTGIDEGGPADQSNIFTTSGTTSAPKFAVHSQGAITGHALDVARFLDMTAHGSVNLQLLPFCGVFGFVQVMATLVAQATLVMPAGFRVINALDLGARYGVTHMFITDDMLHRMLEESIDDQPFPMLRSCMFAGFNTWLHDLPARAEARGIPIQGAFGMSEVFAIFAGRPMAAPPSERHRPGGTLVSTAAAVRARDPETGVILAHGEIGELEFTGPFIMTGYFGSAAATRDTFTADGFLRSGDLGYTEPDHSFTYLQRMTDTLRLGGFLVAPSEIEGTVMSHPGVRDAQVVAAGTAAGNRPVAFVIEADGHELDETAVITYCQQTLPKFKTPVRVVAIDEFPVTRSANGTKIQRTKLRKMAEDLLAGR